MDDDKLMRSADVMGVELKDSARLDEIRHRPDRLDAMVRDAKATTEATFQVSRRSNAIEADRVVYRMTTMFLGAVILVIAVGIIVIRVVPVFVLDKEQLVVANSIPFAIPDSLVAIASAAVGALAGLLSPIGARSS